MFKKVDIHLNGQLITDQTEKYPYESYLTKTTNYSKAAKEFQFANCLYVKDQAGKFNDLTNTGFTEREKPTKESKEIELFGRLQVDLFNQPKLLLPNVPIKIALSQSSSNFCLMHDKDKDFYKVEIMGMTLSLNNTEPRNFKCC
jgi:hypothetical protein